MQQLNDATIPLDADGIPTVHILHDCKHETDFALWNRDREIMLKSQEDAAKDIQKIREAILGNGKPGIKAELATIHSNIEDHEKSISRLWKVFIAVAVAAILTAITGIPIK